MMGRIPKTVFVAAISTAAVVWAKQPTSQSWELRGAEWQQMAAPDGTPVAADPRVDEIERLVDQNRGKDAFKSAVEFLKANSGHPQRDRALFLTSRALYQTGDKVKAFYYCDELLDSYPESPYYQPALDFQYRIADEFLVSGQRRFLGIPFGDYTDEANEMLFRVQQRAPGSRLAEKALLRSADYYYGRSDYDLAGDAYAAYARSYPRSPEVSRVRLKQAWAYLAQFRGLKFDATPVVDAKAQLTDLMATAPELAQEENVAALVERIDSSIAQKMLVTADFYKRTKKPTAAAFMCNQVLSQYPNSPEADQARNFLEKLPQSARDEAERPPVQPVPQARAAAQ